MVTTPRESFLLSFYNNVWQNVRRAETSLWILFPIYITSLTGLSYQREQIGIFLVLFLILIISIIFSSITFNLNLWFVRNMRLVARAEREFLKPTDLNRIIPKRWVTETIPFFNAEPYCLVGIAYLLIGISLSIFLQFFIGENSLTREQITILFFLWGLLLIGEGLFVNKLRRRYNEDVKDTP